MRKSEEKGTIVEIRAGFFIIIAFMLIIGDNSTVLISLFSSFLHESGHIVALILCGGKIDKLVLSSSGMRIDRDCSRLLCFSSEMLIAFSGVAVNMFSALCALIVLRLSGHDLWFNVFGINMVIGIFNLLPLQSLDGARGLEFILLRRIPQERVERVLLIVSVTTAVLIMVFFLLTIIFRAINPSFVIVVIYLLILLINRILQLKKSVI